MDAIPSAPAFPLGDVVCIEQEDGQRSGFPTKEYLMALPSIWVKYVCHPQ
jgi:hypothetical protein